MARPTVYVCMGSDCRKRKSRMQKLLAILEGRARSEVVICQKICGGPVLGVEIDGTLEWFEAVDTPKARAALRCLLETGELQKTLEKRQSKKRRGKLRA